MPQETKQDKKPAQKTKKELLADNLKLTRAGGELLSATLYMAKQVREIEEAASALLKEPSLELKRQALQENLKNLGMDNLTAYLGGLQDIVYLKANPTEVN